MARGFAVGASVCILVFIGGSGVALGDEFFPLHVGDRYEYLRTDALGNSWTCWADITEQTTMKSQDYCHLQSSNYNNDGVIADLGFVRTTADALYGYSASGPDNLLAQKAPVGVKWIVYDPDPDGEDWTVREVVAVGSVTVPYGTFPESYTIRAYQCVDPDNLGLGQTPSWYDTFVPCVGFVKEVDYWVDDVPAPVIQELVRIAPEPATLSLLALGWLALIRHRRTA